MNDTTTRSEDTPKGPKVLMCGSGNAGIGTWRQLVPGKALAQRGCRVKNLQFSKDDGPEHMLKVVANELETLQPDVVWTGKYDGAVGALARKLNEWGVPFIFDIDDYAHGVPDYNPAHGAAKHEGSPVQRAFDSILPHVSALSCATGFLRDFYGDYIGDDDKAYLCPNMIDPAVWGRDVVKVRDHKLRVGLIYNANRHGDMRILLPMLKKLAEEGLVRLVVMGSFPQELWGLKPGFELVYMRHPDIQPFWAMIQQLQPDVVLSRLRDNDFNKAKSNIKYIESAMVGAQFVGSEFGELVDLPGAHLISMDKNDNMDFWEQVLRALANDKAEGGDAAIVANAKSRAHVDEHYVLRTAGSSWYNCLSGALELEAQLE